MTRLLGRSVTAARASVVRAPEEAATAAELADGARLLGELESALVERMEMGEVMIKPGVVLLSVALAGRGTGESGVGTKWVQFWPQNFVLGEGVYVYERSGNWWWLLLKLKLMSISILMLMVIMMCSVECNPH